MELQHSQLGPPISVPVPSPQIPLVSERERAFAVAYVEASIELGRDDSDTTTVAYFRAFPFAVVDRHAARKLSKFLMRRPAVKELVQHLRRELSTRAMVPVSRVVAELEAMGFANIADYGRIDKNGQVVVDLSRATHRSLAGLGEVEVKERVIKVVTNKNEDGEVEETEFVSQRTTKLKLQKLEALDKLAKIHGLYSDGGIDPASALEALDRIINRIKPQIPVRQIEQAAP